MRFDYTHGKTPVYMVALHGELYSDYYYVHYYKDAKKLFDDIKNTEHSPATVSIFDIRKDIRKAFAKIDKA